MRTLGFAGPFSCQRRVLLALKDGQMLGAGEIGWHLRLTRGKARRVLMRLMVRGFVKIERRHGVTNVYYTITEAGERALRESAGAA